MFDIISDPKLMERAFTCYCCSTKSNLHQQIKNFFYHSQLKKKLILTAITSQKGKIISVITRRKIQQSKYCLQ